MLDNFSNYSKKGYSIKTLCNGIFILLDNTDASSYHNQLVSIKAMRLIYIQNHNIQQWHLNSQALLTLHLIRIDNISDYHHELIKYFEFWVPIYRLWSYQGNNSQLLNCFWNSKCCTRLGTFFIGINFHIQILSRDWV